VADLFTKQEKIHTAKQIASSQTKHPVIN